MKEKKNKKILGIIIAKGNSKGLPNKNMRLLNGKPLLWWTIQAAKKSRYLEYTAVSSDGEKILNLSKKIGPASGGAYFLLEKIFSLPSKTNIPYSGGLWGPTA